MAEIRKNIVRIAAIGVASAAPGIAHAEDSVSGMFNGNGQWAGSGESTLEVGVEGGLTLSDFSERFAGGDFSEKLEQDIGGYGAISVGGVFGGGDPAAMPIDWRLVGSMTRWMDNSSSYSDVYSSEPYSGSYSVGIDGGKFDFETIDIEIGKRFGTNNGVQGRVFAGVRGLHLKQGGELFSLDYQSSYNPDSYGVDFGKLATNEFLGAGPRIGGEIRVGQRWGLVVGGSASALYGRSDQVGEYTFEVNYNDDTYDYKSGETQSQWDWVTEATVQGALSFLGEKTRMDVGYRAQNFWNVGGDLFDDASGSDSDNVMVHGPYFSLTRQLD